jgi:hypothetical protein
VARESRAAARSTRGPHHTRALGMREGRKYATRITAGHESLMNDALARHCQQRHAQHDPIPGEHREAVALYVT